MTKPLVGSFDAKKHAYRQTQDGVVISFVVDPADITPEFAVAPLGTALKIGYAEFDPATGEPVNSADTSRERVNETGKSGHDDGMAEILREQMERRRGIVPVPKPKRERGWTLSQQCFRKCQSQEFWKFLGWKFNTRVANDVVAADLVRDWCVVKSRSELDTDKDAAERWENLLNIYETEYRYAGTPAMEIGE